MEQPLSEHLEQHLEFQGVVAFPGDELYKSAIARAWNWRVRESAHPRAIFFATGTRDVVQLVRYATANKLRLSVLNGGMNPSGRSLDGDVVLVLPRSVATPFFPSSAQLTRPMPADVLSIQSRRSHTLPRARCGRTSIGVCTCVQVLFALLKVRLRVVAVGPVRPRSHRPVHRRGRLQLGRRLGLRVQGARVRWWHSQQLTVVLRRNTA